MEIGKDLRIRRFKYGVLAFFLTGLVLCASVFLYVVIDRKHIRWDLTAERELTLSEQTKKIAKSLKKDVRVTAFLGKPADADDAFIRRKVNDVLREYATLSPHILYKLVDPDIQLDLAAQYQVTSAGAIVFEADAASETGTKKMKEIAKSQLFDFARTSEKNMPEFVGEELFTNAIIAVTEVKSPKICFLQGHGERDLENVTPVGFKAIAGQLSKSNNEIVPLSLTNASDLNICDLLIVAGPQKNITDEEDGVLRDWVEEKGRILILLEPSGPKVLKETLKLLKIEARGDLVFDPDRHFLLGTHYPSPILLDHPITRDLKAFDTILASAESLGYSQGEAYTALMKTTDAAWGKANIREETSFNPKKDRKGPLTLGIAIQRASTSPLPGQMQPWAVVVGDADFAANGFIHVPGNSDLALNMVTWLLGEKEKIAIRPKTPDFRRLSLTSSSLAFVKYFCLVGYPLTVLMLGSFFWYRRKKR